MRRKCVAFWGPIEQFPSTVYLGTPEKWVGHLAMSQHPDTAMNTKKGGKRMFVHSPQM